jgi:lipopolysaccharide export system protein LptA
MGTTHHLPLEAAPETRSPIRFKGVTLFFWAMILATHSISAAPINPQTLDAAPPTQDLTQAQSSVLIEAEKEIRCDDLKNRCTASQNVRAQRGDLVLFAESLSAFFSKPLSNPERELTHLVAKGNVRFETPQGKGVAEEAIYDVPKETLCLKGRGVRLSTASESLKAKEIQYQQQKRQMLATGNVLFVQKGKVIKAETLTAFFKPKRASSSPLLPTAKTAFGPSFALSETWELDKVVAKTRVVISTEDYLAEGDWGQYDAATQTATLKGNVTLLQGDTLVKGPRVTVDFKKRTAVMGADSQTLSHPSGGRIRALLKPKAPSKLRSPKQPLPSKGTP